MKYAAIDLETTGLNPETDQILSIGIVLDLDQTKRLDELPKLKLLIMHDRIVGNPFAIQMNHQIIERIARNAPQENEVQITESDIDRHIYGFAGDYGALTAKGKLTCAGKNFASFDRPFLQAAVTRDFHTPLT